MASGDRVAQLLPVLLLVVVLSGHACLRVGALTVNNLYPFGADNGDTVINGGRVFYEHFSSDLIPLPYPVPLFGAPHVKGVFVNSNGAVHFRRSSVDGNPFDNPFPFLGNPYSMVAAYWMDLYYFGCCGIDASMAFRAVDDAALLANITSDIHGSFPTEPLATGFTAEAALIVTWFNVTLASGTDFFSDPLVSTFQTVIAFNTHTVFVGLLYPELTFRLYDDGPIGAQAGFNLGDGVRSFRLPTSFSRSTFDKQTNVGEAGKWWFGLDQQTTIGTFAYLEKPLNITVCQRTRLYGGVGVDACGNQQVMDWDIDNDGAFDDALNTTRPLVDTNALRLTRGTYPISAQVRSGSPCPAAADPLVFSTTLTIIPDGLPSGSIRSIRVDPATGNPNPAVGEAVRFIPDYINFIPCNNITTTVDCGPDSIEDGDTCRFSTTGQKTITITGTQNDDPSASESINVTVVEYKPACLKNYPPGGRALGQRGCYIGQWGSTYICNYPVAAGIRPSTKLYNAFASRSPEDAAVIRRFYGNRTMEQALADTSFPSSQADELAGEAAVALLNALTLPYPQCPSVVKLKFRHALYRGVYSEEATAVFATFQRQNSVGIGNGCTLPLCT